MFAARSALNSNRLIAQGKCHVSSAQIKVFKSSWQGLIVEAIGRVFSIFAEETWNVFGANSSMLCKKRRHFS
mgnify:CR=1 FL=1